MARVAHLSDMHFGAHDPKIAAAAEAWLQQRQPDLVVISGDFTRLRNAEPQSFNWLHVHRHDSIELQVVAWSGKSFQRGHHVAYELGDGGWIERDMTAPGAGPG